MGLVADPVGSREVIVSQEMVLVSQDEELIQSIARWYPIPILLASQELPLLAFSPILLKDAEHFKTFGTRQGRRASQLSEEAQN